MNTYRATACAALLLIASMPVLAAGNGLKGEYFNNTGLAGAPSLIRTDSTVNFEWWGSPGPGIPNNYFSARWSGKVEAPTTGAYKLVTYSNEAIRVWLNNSLVIDNWISHWNAKDTSAALNLVSGQQYDIKIEFRETSGSSVAKLLWSYPGQTETVIPQTRLYSQAVTPGTPPTYLSEMTPALAENGWGQYEKDRANGESRWRDGRTIEMNDIKWGRGLGVHALSDLRYQLMGRYKAFFADIGVDDEVGSRGSVVFEVWVDGVRKYFSPTLTGAAPSTPVAVDITGANELKLIVRDAGDGIGYDHADWAGARVSSTSVNTNPNPDPTPQPPAIPTGLTAMPGNTVVTLAWNSVAGAGSYNVYRGTANGVLSNPVATGVSVTNYKDTAVTNGTTYFYRVAAVAGSLTGQPSAMVSAKPEAPSAPPPPTPTGLAATPGNAQVGLTWSAAAGATGYNVFRSTISGVQGNAIKTNLTGTSMTDTGLTNGTMYFYRVAATNGVSSSAPSSEVPAKPVAPAAPPPPPTPTNLSASPGNSQVTLNWTGSDSAMSYNVYRSTTSGGQGTTPIVTGLTSPTFKDTGLTNNTTYYYKVASVNTNGTSPQSAQVSAKPVAPPAPPAPTGLTAAAGNAEVNLTWTASEGATSYNLYRSTTSGGQGDTPIKTGITETTYKDTGLTNNTTYYYKVAGVNANGVGTKSNQASAKPVLPPVPPAPTGLTAAPGNTSIVLSWAASSTAVTYNVYRSTTSGGQGDTPFATGVTGLTWTDNGLTNGTTYYYKVAGVSPSGTGNKSAQVSAIPFPPAITLTPAQMSAFKFLRQSTWGPTRALVDRVAQIGKPAFLDEQFALPPTPYPQALVDMPNMELVSEQFFQNALQGQDQLRQRVAWALSQIWVVSAVKVDNTHAMVPYIRMLQENAFGNVRNVLELVTLSPAMGEFLDMVNNKKAANGIMPNENYARELLQLFTLGLVQLGQDGVPGTAPAYTQNDVLELSRVLTGWTYGDAIAGDPTKINSKYYLGPMEPVAIYHDTGAKTVLGANFPANQTARADLKQALDLLFNHPNMGPFLVKQLIQKLVKSNPSSQYVSDVVAVFNNNGQGVRGDLRAIVRAILLHAEAAAVPNSGKFSEPALFLTTIARGLNSTVTDYPYMSDFSQDMSQRIWFAPSVFNYFSPGYRLNGVAGPELQIWSTATAMTRTNFVASLVSGGFGSNFVIDTTPYQPYAGNAEALVDTANALLMGGSMGPEMRQAIITALASSSNNTDRIRTVLYLIGSSMQYQVEH